MIAVIALPQFGFRKINFVAVDCGIQTLIADTGEKICIFKLSPSEITAGYFAIRVLPSANDILLLNRCAASPN